MHRMFRTVCVSLTSGTARTWDNLNRSRGMMEGTLTVRTEFTDGRVSCNLSVPDGPPTWIHIFGSVQEAANFALHHDLEFIDNVSTHDKSEEC